MANDQRFAILPVTSDATDANVTILRHGSIFGFDDSWLIVNVSLFMLH